MRSRIGSTAITLGVIAFGAQASPHGPVDSSGGRSDSTCIGTSAPATFASWVRTGDCWREEDRAAEAVTAYRSALKLDPRGSLELFRGLGQSEADAGDPDAARVALRAALKLDPDDVESLYQLGIVYEEDSDYLSASMLFRQVIERRPNDGRAHRNIGFVLLGQGHPEAAIDPLRKAIEIDAEDWKAHLNLSVAYSDTYTSITEEMRELAPQAPSGVVDPNHPITRRLSELSSRLRAFDYRAQSRQEMRTAARLNSGDARVQYNLGTALSEDRTTLAEAVTAFEAALRITPDYYEALRNLAIAQQKLGRFEDAYSTCLKLSTISGSEPWLLGTMASLQSHLGLDAEAESSYRAAIAMDRRDPGPHIGLARLLVRQGHREAAEFEVAAAEALRPELAALFRKVLESR